MRKLFSRTAAALLLFNVGVQSASAEGTKQVIPAAASAPTTAPTDSLSAYFIAPSVGSGSYRGAPAANRLHFYIKDFTTETLYLGVRAYDRGSTSNGVTTPPAEVNVFYRILNTAGNAVSGPTQITGATGNAGRINTYAQAVNGPAIGLLNTAGYSPRTYNPTANGEYSVEIYQSTDNGLTASTDQTLLVYFDLTVASNTLTTYTFYPGRVYSQAWSFITYNNTGGVRTGDATKSFVGTVYGLTADSTVARINFQKGFRPFGFTLLFNKFGVTNTGNFEADRKSANTGATAPDIEGGYNVFLNTPDATIFPRSTAPAAPFINRIYGCSATGYFISATTSAPGDLALLLDLNGTPGYQEGTADRYLYKYDAPAGGNIIPWDGKDGLGVAVSTANVTATLYLRRGRTNLPLYDAELNQNGFSISGVEPVVYSPRLYWDDGALSTGTTGTCDANQTLNFAGGGIVNANLGQASPGRAWDGIGSGLAVPAPQNGGGDATDALCDDYGNVRTLNTWFWTNEVPSTSSSFRLPDCDADGDGIPNISSTGGTSDADDDNDGITDVVESGGFFPLGDGDSDGIPNYLDSTPGVTGLTFTDINKDGVNDFFDADLDGVINSLDLDSDNDGIPDIVEAGGVDVNGDGRVDYSGSWASNDTDGDGLLDRYDAAETNTAVVGVAIANLDTDGDGIPNYLDLDSDNDGIADVAEVGGVDANGDGRLDNFVDTDNDGLADTVDGDVGNNNIAENTANALLVTGTYTSTSNPAPASYIQGINNTDGRGLPNPYDLDSDDDGIADVTEAGGLDANYDGKADGFVDVDKDGFNDLVDGDVGNDGVAENTANTLLPTGTDTNNDGKADAYVKANADGTGMPNPYDLDSDDDGIPDLIEAGGTDTNGGGRIDVGFTDSNNNGWEDLYDPSATTPGINLRLLDANGATAGGAIFDFDNDGIPNYLDLDSDNDGIPDLVEQGGVDANNNGKVDVYADVDNDGFADVYDAINNSTSATLGTPIITTGATRNSFNYPSTYSAGDNLDLSGLINMLDLDADGDGITDVKEAGFTESTTTLGFAAGTLGTNGWSITVSGSTTGTLAIRNTDGIGNANYLDIDSDDDGIVDNIEGQTTAAYVAPSGADTDADGIDNAYDATTVVGGAGIIVANANIDGDILPDYIDLDTDNDGYPDAFEGWDTDGDNLPNRTSTAVDADGDGLLDGYDNTISTTVANPTNGTTPASYPNLDVPGTTQLDWREVANSDTDAIANNTDLDDDNDGITDINECGGFDPTADADSDGIPNYLDKTPGTGLPAFVDANGDGINDAYDADRDGIINSLDLDSDNDGIPDLIEAGGTDTNGDGVVDVLADTNGNGIPDKYDPAVAGGVSLTNLDTDGDGIPNSRDLDSDGDGIPDVVEAGGIDANNDGRIDNFTDANGNGFANSVETGTKLIVTGADANNDGKPDTYPVSIANVDGTGLPNPYDLDSDGDGILDSRESRLLKDTDFNGVISSAESPDTDGDGWADAIKASTTTTLVLANTDTRGGANYLDIDADDDGITDNVEGQTTAAYKLPLGVDADNDGIDDAYDNNVAAFGGSANNGITSNDHDGDGTPDYVDTDSDNDGQSDLREGQGNAGYTITNFTDTDGDGLLDVFDIFNISTLTTNLTNNVTMTKMGTNGSTTGPSGTAGTSTSAGSNAPIPQTGTGNRDWRNGAVLLAVKLVDFSAVYNNHATNLSWTAANEARSDRYVVERSVDGTNFQAITSVNATGNGGKYAATDNAVPAVNVVYYRLQMVDANGTVTYSKVIAIKLVTDKMNLSIYPNPVIDVVSISFASAKTQAVTIKVYSATGVQVMTKTVTAQTGTNTLQLNDWSHLPTGDYMIEVGNDNFKMIQKISHLH